MVRSVVCLVSSVLFVSISTFTQAQDADERFFRGSYQGRSVDQWAEIFATRDVTTVWLKASALERIHSDRPRSAATRTFLRSLLRTLSKKHGLHADDLQKLGRPAVPLLVEGLFAKDPDERMAALYALKQMGTKAEAALPHLIKILKDRDLDYLIRQIAAEGLGKIGFGSESVVGPLLDTIDDPDDCVRFAVEEALKKIGPAAAAAVPRMSRALGRKNDADVRRYAASVLAHVGKGSKPALPQLIVALDDPDEYVRRDVRIALSRIGPAARAAVPKLIRTLQQTRKRKRTVQINSPAPGLGWQVDDAAAAALQRIGVTAKDIPELMKLLDHNRGEVAGAVDDILQQPQKSIAAGLVEALKHGDASQRRAAAKYLRYAKSPTEETTAALQTALHDAIPDVRVFAAISLGTIAPEDATAAIPLLIEALRAKAPKPQWGDREPTTRELAMVALEKIGPRARAAIPALIDALSDGGALYSSWKLHNYEAASALSSIGKAALSPLIEAMGHKNAVVRQGAVEALRGMGKAAKPAIGELVRALGDKSYPVRYSTMKALGELGADAQVAISTLLPATLDNTALSKYGGRFGSIAASALAGIGQPALPVLIRSLRREDMARGAAEALGYMGSAAKSAVPELIACVQQDRAAYKAIEALGRIGPEAAAAVPVLLKSLQSKDGSLRFVAAGSLINVDPARIDVALLAIPEKGWQYSRIEMIRDVAQSDEPRFAASIPGILRALKNISDAWTRRVCVDAIASFGAKAEAALPQLIHLAQKSDEPQLRGKAIMALAQIDIRATRTFAVVMKALSSPHHEVRWSAVWALGQGHALTGEKREVVLKALIDALHDPGGDSFQNSRGAAAFSLGRLGVSAKRATPRLVKLLQDSEDSIHPFSIAGALEKIAPEVAERYESLTKEETRMLHLDGRGQPVRARELRRFR